MRKILSTIVLALGLVFAGAPALGATVSPDPVTYCNDDPGTGPEGCIPTECKPVMDRWNLYIISVEQLFAQQRVTIDQQHRKIERQAKVIKRLRHRLAAR